MATRFAIASASEVIGGIEIVPQEDVASRSAEIRFWLGEPFWGQGVASATVEAVTRYGFTELGLGRLYAYLNEGNRASSRVMEKAGYVVEGRTQSSGTKRTGTGNELVYSGVSG